MSEKKPHIRFFRDVEAMLIMSETLALKDSSLLTLDDRTILNRLYTQFDRTWKRSRYIAVEDDTVNYLGTIKGKIRQSLPNNRGNKECLPYA